MASTAQIEANRRHARKSTGSKTQRGKEKARLNAFKHGMAARTIVPVLPQEDPRELDAKIRNWVDNWQPQSAQEAELVGLGARLAWQIDRVERFETAHLSRRVRKARRRVAGAPDLKRLKEVTEAQATRRLRAREVRRTRRRVGRDPRGPGRGQPPTHRDRLRSAAT
ncbi:MAG: hypothetical protein ACP5XB_21730, partial [Isosphaeraceae bacterium]